jgi:hypothetical protein
MSLDPNDLQVLQSIAENLKIARLIQADQRDLAQLQARKDFLLLTYSPARVAAILRDEFGDDGENVFVSVRMSCVAKPR